MIIMRAFKTELALNNVQKTACIRHAEAARFTYNRRLARKKEAFATGQKTPTAIDLHRELNRLKKTELSWMYEVPKRAPQEALRHRDNAFMHFFRRVKEKRAGKNVKVGFPRFKSKRNGMGSFHPTGVIHVFEETIQLPRLGLVRLKEGGYLPTSGAHILGATINEKAGLWFVSLQVKSVWGLPRGCDRRHPHYPLLRVHQLSLPHETLNHHMTYPLKK
jgi:putative transposase